MNPPAARAPAAPSPPGAGAHRLVLASFGLFGFAAGAWQVALPDLQAALRLSPGALGAALTLGLLASFPAMFLGGRLADRWGARAVIAASALFMALAFLGFDRVQRYEPFVLLLMLLFGAWGALDVGINTAAIGVEQVTGRRIMSYYHAAWSGLAGLAALAAGLLLAAGVPFRLLYLGVAALLGLLALAAARARELPRVPRAAGPAAASGPGRVPAAVYLLAGVAALSLLSESTLETWSAIYLRATLGLSVAVGSLGPVVFHSAMLLGRLGAGRAIQRLGRRRLLLAAGGLTAAGMALALGTVAPPVILAGLLLAGLALSSVVPAAFSLAGDFAPGRAGAASSTITTVGYTGLLVGPLAIGALAEWAGLRLALGLIVLAGLGISLLVGRVSTD